MSWTTNVMVRAKNKKQKQFRSALLPAPGTERPRLSFFGGPREKLLFGRDGRSSLPFAFVSFELVVVVTMTSTLSAHQPSTRSISSTTAASTKPGHVPLHRRLLFPQLAASTPVPPLLKNASPELNTELYDLLALALRAHITPWWSKITRYDRDFIPQVAAILRHVFRVLEERVREADLTNVLLRAVPIVLTQHYEDYRAAEEKVGTSYAAGGALDVPQLFHQLQGHMAIDAEGHIDPSYIRHTLDHVLEVCLPAEDYESDAEHAIVREVIAKVVMNDIAPLLVQPWFIHKILLDLLRPGSEKVLSPPASKVRVGVANCSCARVANFFFFLLSCALILSRSHPHFPVANNRRRMRRRRLRELLGPPFTQLSSSCCLPSSIYLDCVSRSYSSTSKLSKRLCL